MDIGSFVMIDGLVNAAQYNGMVGVIVARGGEASSSQGHRWVVQLLDHGEGWEQDSSKRFGGRQMSVKESNLTLSPDSSLWREQNIGGANKTLLELVQQTPLGSTDNCLDFCESLWNCCFETVPGASITSSLCRLLAQEKGHKVYWVCLHAVQHYFILEKCGGRFRVLQSHVQLGPGLGYTAKGWCTLSSKTVGNPVRKVFGGGLTIGNKELELLFDAIEGLQNCLKGKLVPHLLKHVPGVDASAVAALLRRNPHSLSEHDLAKVTEALETASEWSNAVEGLIGSLGITTIDPFSDPVFITQRDRRLFEIPQVLYRKVHSHYAAITGETSMITPMVFIGMVNRGLWWENRQNPLDGGAEGFAIRCAALDVVLSKSEGRRAAAANTRKIRGMCAS